MRLSWKEYFAAALPYDAYLQKYATEAQRQHWGTKFEHLSLTDAQRERLAQFSRKMHVVCMAGAWCGDCVDQCPMLGHIEAASPNIEIRYLDRDDCDPAFQEAVKICGGNRVPVVMFLTEDFEPTGMFGDRTLAKYRSMVEQLTGAACSTGISLAAPGGEMDPLTQAVLQEWLDQFERHQWILRTSTRLREKHND